MLIIGVPVILWSMPSDNFTPENCSKSYLDSFRSLGRAAIFWSSMTQEFVMSKWYLNLFFIAIKKYDSNSWKRKNPICIRINLVIISPTRALTFLGSLTIVNSLRWDRIENQFHENRILVYIFWPPICYSCSYVACFATLGDRKQASSIQIPSKSNEILARKVNIMIVRLQLKAHEIFLGFCDSPCDIHSMILPPLKLS